MIQNALRSKPGGTVRVLCCLTHMFTEAREGPAGKQEKAAFNASE